MSQYSGFCLYLQEKIGGSMSFTDDVVKKKKSQLGLNKRVQKGFEEQKEQKINEMMDPEFSEKIDFFQKIDEYIKMGCKNKLILNSLNELHKDQSKVEIINTNPNCIECQSPESKYELSNSEVQILQEINHFEAELLQGIKIGDLYKTTKIVLCDALNESDLLGSYSREEKHPLSKSYYPVVEIYMDRVETIAKELGCDRKYVTASVYIHEMMHRYYDIRPDLGWKKSVTEIEEPMAVFGAMQFCEEFDQETLLRISRNLTKGLQNSKLYDQYNYYVYILGIEMFNRGIENGLIYTYRHISLTMHNSESEVEGFVNPIDSYLDTCMKNRDSLANIVGLIKSIIDQYANFFPLHKGIQ